VLQAPLQEFAVLDTIPLKEVRSMFMPAEAQPIDVFVSYARPDQAQARELVAVLERQGLTVWIDDRLRPAYVFPVEIEHALRKARRVVVLWSPRSVDSRWVKAEASLGAYLCKLVPLMIESCVPPRGLHLIHTLQALSLEESFEAILEAIRKPVDPLQARFAPQPREERSRLPTTSGDLFGRSQELDMLDLAWSSGGGLPETDILLSGEKTNVLVFVANGGGGKTALCNHWLEKLGRQNGWLGASRVYGWSFYSQGHAEDHHASADTFFQHALTWFGYQGEPIKSPWERGLKLAELVQRERTLLILDGLEPIQYPPGPMLGRLRDQGMQALLKNLAVQNRGLCLITTRSHIDELKTFSAPRTIAHDLNNLPVQEGVRLLRHLGVYGIDKEREYEELESAVRDFDSHALALNLLGSYLVTVYGGDVINRHRIFELTEEPAQGGHAKRIMRSYERWLSEANKPELSILYLLGLFDRPAPLEAIAAVREATAIPALTDVLEGITEAGWQFALGNLRKLKLVNPQDGFTGGSLDTHPLVREFFGSRLKAINPSGFTRAHAQLFDYFDHRTATGDLPETLLEMEPIFASVYHGCAADMQHKIFHHVYRPKIHRGKSFTARILGAPGDDLAVLSHFFAEPWEVPARSLEPYSKAVLCNYVSDRLRAVGRLSEAVAPMRAALERIVRIRNRAPDSDPFGPEWGPKSNDVLEQNISIGSSSLIEDFLYLGRANEALEFCKNIIRDGSAYESGYFHAVMHAALACALHFVGKTDESEVHFTISESANSVRPGRKLDILYSFQGFIYCDLLISLGRFGEVIDRCNKTFVIANESGKLAEIGLDRLSFGRAHFYSEAQRGGKDFSLAMDYISEAVLALRGAATLHHLPRALLARAAVFQMKSQYSDALSDVAEAFEISYRGGMLMHLADCHLAAGRLAAVAGDAVTPLRLNEAESEGATASGLQNAAFAEQLIARMNYGRRKPEYCLLMARLSLASGKAMEARQYIQKAGECIAGMRIKLLEQEFHELEALLKNN
jgi:tetratricopeptide (TPR) repeat protein